MVEIRIGDKKLGDRHPCLISMEIGATHTGVESAKKLLDAVAQGGADAAKFQTLNADRLMGDRSPQIEYHTPDGKRSESVYQALKRRELSPDGWREVRSYSRSLGLLFISTPSDPETIDLLVELKADAIKIAKSDINCFPLVEYAAKTGLPIILDSRERFEDVCRSFEICRQQGNANVMIMHCPSGYPAESAGIHLSVIPHIRSIFNCPVGYSDHSLGTKMNFAALGLGTDMIEKTVSPDRTTDAVEHYMSLEPGEIGAFVRDIREIEDAMGNPRIMFTSRVNPNVRRSVVAGRGIMKGETVQLKDLDFRRPGTHLPADQYERIVGHEALHDIPEGTFLSPEDFG